MDLMVLMGSGSNVTEVSSASRLDPIPIVELFNNKTSAADILRGKKIPITRLTPESLAKAKSHTKKVETLLKKDQSESLLSLRRPSDQFESSLVEALGPFMYLKKNDDAADVSSHPSYNIMKFKHLNSYVKYLDSKEKYDKQFMREMEHLIESQRNICDQYFLKKILCYNTRWPPLHTKRELNVFVRKFFQLPPKAKARVEYLMKTDLSLGN